MKRLTRKDIAGMTGRKREWIRTVILEMQKSGRYPENEIIRDGYLLLVSEKAFIDWLSNRKKVKNGELIPPYKKEVEE